ncbi:MAG: hypothetical protein WCO71_02345 [Pseudomonadota bacterium]
MSHNSQHDLYEQRQSFYLTATPQTRGAVAFLVLIGAVTLGIGMAEGLQSRVWGALLFNTFFFFALALGGSAFSAMQDVLGAKWGRPVMRIHESFCSFVPVACGIFLAVLACVKFNIAGAHNVYSWIASPKSIHHFWGKRTWLSENFWVLRDVFAMGVICGIVFWQIGMKTARDRAFVAGDKVGAEAMGIKVRDTLRYWSAPILVVYAFAFSLLGFDLLMSLAPTWFSTLFGGWLFAVMMQTLMATLMLFMWAFKGTAIGQVIQRQQFHDVGKLMHGFTIFFAYLTYAHILTYWYGNMPEETGYYIARLHYPWKYIVMIAPLVSFVIPLYTMIPKASKWTKMISGPIAIGILTAQWFTYMLVVMPEVVKDEDFGIPYIELGLFFGVFGLFLASVFAFGRRNPMVAVADPLLHAALAEGHH